MKTYNVKYFPEKPVWSEVPEALVDVYPWGCPWDEEDYLTVAAMAALTDAGLHILMACDELEPLATFTENDQPVCQDSCLEFFVNFAPEKGSDYLNLECNANGAIWSAYGPDRAHRQFLKDMGLAAPKVTVHKSEFGWGVEYLIPQETIQALCGRALKPGDTFSANFYKCGDCTDTPHYAVWNPVEAPQPDYHRPECFGIMKVDEA